MSYRQHLTERLIQILFKLVRRPHSRQELACEFKVDPKTISRDIDALTKEFPIVDEQKGREVFYKFTDDYKYIIPPFSVEEVAVILLAQQSIAEIGFISGSTQTFNHSKSLLEKIRQALPYSIVNKLSAYSEIYGSSVIPAKNFAVHIQTIDELTSCAIRRKKASINYLGLNNNAAETRIIHPYSVYFDPDGATLKLIGFDEKRGRKTVFSVDRIQKINESDEKFIRPKDYDLKKYLDENCFNGIYGEPVTVQLKTKGVTARIFAERKFHPSQKVVERKRKRGSSPETITIEMRVARGRGLERFIIGWLPDIEVISPMELRESVKQTLLKGLEKF
jgi:predicted DNA-binding transcriptional regulator YafY